MSENSFLLKVYSPAGLVFEETVVSVVLPGYDEGEVGILPGHVHYVGTVGTGILRFETSTPGEVGTVSVSGGFCRMREGEFSVLANKVVMAE